MNASSSRSHSVFTLNLTRQNRSTDGVVTVRVSSLNLVDLAGSESQKLAHTEGVRLKEAGQINKSLSELGNVIHALTLGLPHIPYRNSKLTFLLKDSLGGSAKMCLIATLNSDKACAAESLSTLQFAQRAKQVVNRAARSKLGRVDVQHCAEEEREAELQRLRDQLASLQTYAPCAQ